MSYTPDPTNGAAPLDTVAASTAAAEFRALKTYLQAKLPQTGQLIVGYSNRDTDAGLLIPAGPTDISRTTYAALTAWIVALDYPWGMGDGITTIGMPYNYLLPAVPVATQPLNYYIHL